MCDTCRAATTPVAAVATAVQQEREFCASPAQTFYDHKRVVGTCRGTCSGCDVCMQQYACGTCANTRAAQQVQTALDGRQRAAIASGQLVVPPSGSFAFSALGAFQPYGRVCALQQPPPPVVLADGRVTYPIAPPGMKPVKVADPNVWSIVPNWVPPAMVINAYYHGAYIRDLYDQRPSKYGACAEATCGGGDPSHVLSPYTWPLPVPVDQTPTL